LFSLFSNIKLYLSKLRPDLQYTLAKCPNAPQRNLLLLHEDHNAGHGSSEMIICLQLYTSSSLTLPGAKASMQTRCDAFSQIKQEALMPKNVIHMVRGSIALLRTLGD